MPTNKKPGRKYRPKGIIKNPLTYVIGGIKPASEDIRTKCKILSHSAMLALTQGRGTKDDWEKVAEAVNVGLVLCEMGYGLEFKQDLIDAQIAMTLLRDRYRETGKLIFRPEDMVAVNEALSLHDQQIDLASVFDVAKAAVTVERSLSIGNYVKVDRKDTTKAQPA